MLFEDESFSYPVSLLVYISLFLFNDLMLTVLGSGFKATYQYAHQQHFACELASRDPWRR